MAMLNNQMVTPIQFSSFRSRRDVLQIYPDVDILCWLVVYLPLWNIWVRHLGLWHSHYLDKQNMFQTTNQQRWCSLIPKFKRVIFHSYVSLPKGTLWEIQIIMPSFFLMDKLRSHGDQEIGRQQNDGQIPDSMRIDLQNHLVTRNSVASGNGSYRSLWKKMAHLQLMKMAIPMLMFHRKRL